MTETNIYCKQLPVEQQWYAEEKQKWNLVGKMVTDLKFVTRSEKELGGLPFCHIEEKKKSKFLYHNNPCNLLVELATTNILYKGIHYKGQK